MNCWVVEGKRFCNLGKFNYKLAEMILYELSQACPKSWNTVSWT